MSKKVIQMRKKGKLTRSRVSEKQQQGHMLKQGCHQETQAESGVNTQLTNQGQPWLPM